MARTTLHCCDTYVADQRGKLAIGEHKELKTPEEAVRRIDLWTPGAEHCCTR